MRFFVRFAASADAVRYISMVSLNVNVVVVDCRQRQTHSLRAILFPAKKRQNRK